MPYLFRVHDTDGNYHGTCSRRCYEALGGTSHCVCGGINHGVGLRRAAANSLDLQSVRVCGRMLPADSPHLIVAKNPALESLAEQTTWPWAEPAHVQIATELARNHRQPDSDPNASWK